MTLLLAVLLLIQITPILPAEQSRQASALTDSLTTVQLKNEKLRQEIIQLRHENLQYERVGASIPTYAPFLTALAALAGILITIWKQITESNRQKELDREQRKAEQTQRRIDSRQRTDDQFNKIAASLGAESEAVRAGGAVSIATFSKTGYEDYYAQAFMLVLANLKIDHTAAVRSLLVGSFERLARAYLPLRGEPLDLSHLTLTAIDLSELDLTGADLGHTDLRRANLSGAVLRAVRGYGANCRKARFSRADLQAARLHTADFSDAHFHEASLIDVKMKNTTLVRAQFHRARLQGAHFENSVLTDATFHQADLNESFFRGTTGWTTKTMKSMIRAKNWRNAHFDADVLQQLSELADQRDQV